MFTPLAPFSLISKRLAFYEFYAGPNEVPLTKHYDSELDEFNGYFDNPGSLNRAELMGWQAVAVDKDGNTASFAFDIDLPNHETASAGSYVYSAQYTPKDENGISALEAMNIADNNLSIKSNADTQSFTINFRTYDERAANYSVAFYGSAPEHKYIGLANQGNASIVSTPIIKERPISLELPWSEIKFLDGAKVSDIHGIHINLFSEAQEVDYRDNYFSHSYISYSEYVVLQRSID